MKTKSPRVEPVYVYSQNQIATLIAVPNEEWFVKEFNKRRIKLILFKKADSLMPGATAIEFFGKTMMKEPRFSFYFTDRISRACFLMQFLNKS